MRDDIEKFIIRSHLQKLDVTAIQSKLRDLQFTVIEAAITATIDCYEKIYAELQKVCNSSSSQLIPRYHKDLLIYYNRYRLDLLGRKITVMPVSGSYEDISLEGYYIGECDLDPIIRENPILYVPHINFTVLGCESFWRLMGSSEPFSPITTEQIKRFYHKMISDLFGSD